MGLVYAFLPTGKLQMWCNQVVTLIIIEKIKSTKLAALCEKATPQLPGPNDMHCFWLLHNKSM